MTDPKRLNATGGTTTARIELVRQLRAEAKAAEYHIGTRKFSDPDLVVVAGGIMVLAKLCAEAADEIERQDQDRAYGEQQASLLVSETPPKSSVLDEIRKLPRIVPAELDPDQQHRRNGEYVSLYEVEKAIKYAFPSARQEYPKEGIDKLAALMVKNDGMDVDICSPGNHGGRGKDANRWLVTLTPADSSNIREFFGDTLEEAINYAAR